MESRTWSRIRTVIIWTLSVPVAIQVGMAGVSKFSSEVWFRMFAEWGYPGWFRAFIGIVEVAGAVGLLIPKASRYGAALLGVTMVGAAINNLVHHSSFGVTTPLVYVVFLSVVIWLRTQSAQRAARSMGAS